MLGGLGGDHPLFSPRNAWAILEVDVVCRGEGEYTLRELCQRISKGQTDFRGIAGTSITHQGEVHHNPTSPLD